MFSASSSPPKEKSDPLPSSNTETSSSAPQTETADADPVRERKFSSTNLFSRRSSEDQSSGGERKRRSSTVTKAATLFNNARNSFNINRDPQRASRVLEPQLEGLETMDPALSVPQGSLNNSAGESLPTPRSSFRVGVAEDRNRKWRRTMEDTHSYLYNFLGTPSPGLNLQRSSVNGKDSVGPLDTSSGNNTDVVETDNGYFAIFDGHAGTFAAEWCGKKLHLVLEDIMRKNPNLPVPELLDQTFTSVDQQLEKLPVKNSGCTAVIALLRWEDRVPNSQSATGSIALAPAAAAAASSKDGGDPESGAQTLPKLQQKAVRQRVLYTANVGDARIVLSRNGKALRLSYDHKGSDENEGKRIANAGGLILNNRVNGVLAVTRALGDAYLKDLVTGHPYTTETVVQPAVDEFIIMACDGLWDVCSDQEAVDLIRNVQDAQEASKILVDHALARFSTDNLSCMVIRFDGERLKEVINRVVEPLGVHGDPSTDLTNGVSEADKIVEGARKSMVNAGIMDNPETVEEARKKIIRKMAEEESGPELAINDQNKPEVDDKTTTDK